MKDIMNPPTVVITRAEYIEVAPHVRLHITDAGVGSPIVFIHGWPLSDEMFEYQYSDLISKNFRVIGITLRGFGKSDKPHGVYDYDVHAQDMRKVLTELDIEDAVLVGFSMGGAIAIRFTAVIRALISPGWFWPVQLLHVLHSRMVFPTIFRKML